MPGQWAVEALNAGSRGQQKGVMVGPWVEMRQEESMSDAAQAPQGSRATGRVEESDLSPATLRALFLNIELGIRVCIHQRSMHTGPMPGAIWKEAGCRCALSVVSLCLGSLLCYLQGPG